MFIPSQCGNCGGGCTCGRRPPPPLSGQPPHDPGAGPEGGADDEAVARSRSRSARPGASRSRGRCCTKTKTCGRSAGFRGKLTKCGVKGRARKRRAYAVLRGKKHKCLKKLKNYVRMH